MEVLYQLSYVGGRIWPSAGRCRHPSPSRCRRPSRGEPGGQSGLFTSVQPRGHVVTRVPQATTEGSSPVTPMPWVKFETAGSCPDAHRPP